MDFVRVDLYSVQGRIYFGELTTIRFMNAFRAVSSTTASAAPRLRVNISLDPFNGYMR